MNRKILFTAGLIAVLAVAAATIVYAAGRDDLRKLRSATEQFQSIEAVKAAGYSQVPNLDYCFDNPGTGGMGYHYIDTARLDTVLDPLKPEAIVYAPDANGKLVLAAVEFIVPADKWDAVHRDELPTVLGQHLHLNKDLGVYVLHAWLWEKNPSGVFEDWNPEVSCP
ncbi:MAG TPA: hypothetical protein VLE49_11985 [Anaerolineales bacterium]|nr:hypothetical protein [Anaerolineales bacterium]